MITAKELIHGLRLLVEYIDSKEMKLSRLQSKLNSLEEEKKVAIKALKENRINDLKSIFGI